MGHKKPSENQQSVYFLCGLPASVLTSISKFEQIKLQTSGSPGATSGRVRDSLLRPNSCSTYTKKAESSAIIPIYLRYWVIPNQNI